MRIMLLLCVLAAACALSLQQAAKQLRQKAQSTAEPSAVAPREHIYIFKKAVPDVAEQVAETKLGIPGLRTPEVQQLLERHAASAAAAETDAKFQEAVAAANMEKLQLQLAEALQQAETSQQGLRTAIEDETRGLATSVDIKERRCDTMLANRAVDKARRQVDEASVRLTERRRVLAQTASETEVRLQELHAQHRVREQVVDGAASAIATAGTFVVLGAAIAGEALFSVLANAGRAKDEATSEEAICAETSEE